MIVTLRAMASVVLTQQTMGRGLRLPFGRYTGVGQIDQLDIISHQSFRELLAAENVLEQFGLEDAVQAEDQAKVAQAIRAAAQEQEAGGVGVPRDALGTSAGTGAQDSELGDNASAPGASLVPVGGESFPADGEPSAAVSVAVKENDSVPGGESALGGFAAGAPTPVLGVREIGATHVTAPDPADLKPVEVKRNPQLAGVTYRFPVTTITVQQPRIDLSEIADPAIEGAARRVTSTGDVLYRKEIIAALGKKLGAQDAESAVVDSIHIETSEAQDALIKLVMNMSIVPKTDGAVQFARNYLIPKFMKHVAFEQWTVKSLESARIQLHELLHEYVTAAMRAVKELPVIRPKELPNEEFREGYMLPLGEKIWDQIDIDSEDASKEFVRERTYAQPHKCLYLAESFDSFTGEYKLARLLSTSPSIVWWHRLHIQYQAFIYYTSRDKYYPDFVALDSSGVHWIIEGKDARGRMNYTVQAKRKAAEALVRKLAAHPDYAGQKWGYLIAYEDDTAKAETWDDLKALASPVSNAL